MRRLAGCSLRGGAGIWYNADVKTNVSKYLAIADELKRDILSGRYDSHERFPSEETLARRFGASRPTVERALRELKRQGLLESRAGSGSYLTFAAKHATGAIGIIAPDYRAIDFFTRLCDAIAAEARARGYDVLLGDVSTPDAADRGRWAIALAQAYAARRTAGVLLEPVDLIPESHAATRKVVATLAAKNIPVVLLDRDYLPFPARSRYDLVGIDNLQAGYRVARHMIESGARRLRFLTHANYANTIRARIHGVAQAVMDAGLDWKASCVIETDPADEALLRRLMHGKNAPDAFVCRNDPTAARLMQTLCGLGFKIPGDVRVAGFDDDALAALLSPSLTTVHQPVKKLADTAVGSLMQRIRSPKMEPRSIMLDAPLVVRDSIAALRAPDR